MTVTVRPREPRSLARRLAAKQNHLPPRTTVLRGRDEHSADKRARESGSDGAHGV